MAIQLKANLDGNSGAIQVNSVDVLTFDQDGNVVITGSLSANGGTGIGETITGNLEVTGEINAYSVHTVNGISAENINASGHLACATLGTGSINTGNITSSGVISAVDFNSTSDARLKDDVQEISGLDLLSKIHPVAFKWKETGAQSYGVLAQELESVMPELVSIKDDGTYGVSYIPMIAMLVSAIQTLSAELSEIKSPV